MNAPGEGHAAYVSERIRDGLARGGVHQLGLSVVVEADRVVLSGTVDGPECRNAVLEQVAELADGRTVVDDLDWPPDRSVSSPERIS